MRISDWSSDVCSSDLGVAVEKHLLEPVVELELLNRLRLVFERGIPAVGGRIPAHIDKAHQSCVITQEMGVHVDDMLRPQRFAPSLGGAWFSGFRRVDRK